MLTVVSPAVHLQKLQSWAVMGSLSVEQVAESLAPVMPQRSYHVRVPAQQLFTGAKETLVAHWCTRDGANNFFFFFFLE